MTAAEALWTTRAAGIEIGLDGDNLVLDALSRNKAGIVALLRHRMDEPSSGGVIARALPCLWRR